MKKSFTLIELLIVLVIIGILTTLAIPSLKKYQDKAKNAEAMSMLSAFADSLWRYYTEVAAFPASTTGNIPPSNLDTTIPPSTKYFTYIYITSLSNPPSPGQWVVMDAVRTDYLQFPDGSAVGFNIFYIYNSTVVDPYKQPMNANWIKYYGKIVRSGVAWTSTVPSGGWK